MLIFTELLRTTDQKLIIANGATNHSHFLISMGKTLDISRLVGDIKRASSLWMKQHDRAFYWQEGYGAFSIGESQVTHVVRYIEGQKQHHEKQDFKDEFRGLLDRYKVEHDERYVWD
ncbi:MAG: transposase IS200-family protein [Acidobacteria bacterium OLB17]|nr:MAG: transposase IS200-family protein [Acidobacteria bacterium OLB17]